MSRKPVGDRVLLLRKPVADRVALLRTLSAAGPRLLVLLAMARLVVALAPAALALTMAVLVHRLLASDTDHMVDAALLPLTTFGVVILLERAANSMAEAIDFLATQRVDGAQRADIARRAAATATIDILERTRVRELLREARADKQTWVERTPGMAAVAQLNLCMRVVGAMTSCAVLVGYAWWLAVLVLGAALIYRQMRRRRALRHIGMQRAGVGEGIRAEHWLQMVTEATDGKEVRTFGLADWAIDRSQHHQLAMCQPRWDVERDDNIALWRIAALVGPVLITGFALVAADTARGHHPVSLLTAVFTAAWSLLGALEPYDAFDIEGGLVSLRAHGELRAELADSKPADTRPADRNPADLNPADSNRHHASTPPTSTATSRAPATHEPADGVRPQPPLVRFEGVGFRYPGMQAERSVLDGLDMEIRPGELLAIVGLNGAGKSTLIKLLSGLYEPTAGRITIDGRPTDGLWRQQLSVVFQDFVHYPLSAADNITLGRPAGPASDDLLGAASSDAGLDQVIDRLPDGWDTPLSRTRKGGVDLSGGQWQQVALARALYAVRAGARLLVLDEPTAHLDVHTEFDVFARLIKHRGDSSIVLISHRLSTVRQADRIAFLEAGRITESGSHEELIAQGGRYAELFAIQAERFAREKQQETSC